MWRFDGLRIFAVLFPKWPGAGKRWRHCQSMYRQHDSGFRSRLLKKKAYEFNGSTWDTT